MTREFCTTLQRACERSERCRFAPRNSTTGLLHAKFFVPCTTGENCKHYEPIGSSDDND